jgi:hypothetical protein
VAEGVAGNESVGIAKEAQVGHARAASSRARSRSLDSGGQRQAEIRHREWEEQQRRWRKEEAKRKEAFKARRQQLLDIIEQWAFARNMEQFFADVERRLEGEEPQQRDAITIRLERTRKVFGGTDALGRFNDWISASERLQLAGDDDE